MSDERKNKKRLGMLPEILPAPQVISAVGPRQRTLDNLRRLAAAAGAAAALHGCGNGSGNGSGTGSSGYAVVDPMPPPARCSGLGDTIDATVAWRTPGTLVLTLGAPRMEGATYLDVPPRLESGGTLGTVDIQPQAVSIEITPTANDVYFAVRAHCPAGDQELTVHINRNEVPPTGTHTIQLGDMAI
jgi:hypothetical protein